MISFPIIYLLAQAPLVVPISWLQLLKDFGSAGAVTFVVCVFLKHIKITTDNSNNKLDEMNKLHIASNEAMFEKMEKMDNRSVDVLVRIAETINEHNNAIRGHNEAIVGLKNELQEIRLSSKQPSKMIEGN